MEDLVTMNTDRWNHLTQSQRRRYSENALKEKFNVSWLLYEYDGKHTDDYPGDMTAFNHPTYGNCTRCHLMGPMGDLCYNCLPFHRLWDFHRSAHRYVMIIAEQLWCDRHERWYNPEFLHNTNDAEQVVDEPDIPDTTQVVQKHL